MFGELQLVASLAQIHYVLFNLYYWLHLVQLVGEEQDIHIYEHGWLAVKLRIDVL